MFGISFRKEKVRGARRSLQRLIIGFGRKSDGAAAVEFALVVVPFFALMFAIIELALVFWAGQVLETATRIRTSIRRVSGRNFAVACSGCSTAMPAC